MKYTKNRRNNNNHNNTLSNNSFLTSKNNNKLVYEGGRYVRKNDIINKKTRTSLPLRTLERLNKYGMYNIYTQDGGYITGWKFESKMKKVKKIIKKLGKYEMRLNEFSDSYEAEVKTFKRLGDKKADSINDKLRSKRREIIISFIKNNMDKEHTFKTSNFQQNLEMIKINYISADKEIKQLDKEIKEETKKHKEFIKVFNKEKETFAKIFKKRAKINNFYTEQKEIKDKYVEIADGKKLDKKDRKLKIHYEKNKEDIDYVISYGKEKLEELNKGVENKDTTLDKSKTYSELYDKLLTSKYNSDLNDWETKYKNIYENIIDIDNRINYLNQQFNKLNEYVELIKRELNIIYKTINKTNQLNSINKLLEIFASNEKILENVKELMKKIKIALIQENEIEDITNITSYSEAAFKIIENNINNLKNHLVIDKKEIENNYIAKKLEGGARSSELKDIDTIDKLLDSDYKDLDKILKRVNDDLKDTNKDSHIYKENSEDFLKMIQIYFNIYLFFLYYIKNRSDAIDSPIVEKDLNLDTSDKDIILWFIKIVDLYKKINNKPSNIKKEYKELDNNYKDFIIEYTKERYIIKLETFFEQTKMLIENYFRNIDSNNKFFNIGSGEKESIKNLYYSLNGKKEDIFDNFDIFAGYDKNLLNNQNIDKYKSKYNITLTDNIWGKSKDFFDKDFLHNHYEDSYVIYKDTHHRTGSDTNPYKFYSVYFNEDKFKAKTITIKIKKNNQFNYIKKLYNDLVNFIQDRLEETNILTIKNKKDEKDEIPKNINESNHHIFSNDNIKDNKHDDFFCSNDIDGKIITAIENFLLDPLLPNGYDVNTGLTQVDKTKIVRALKESIVGKNGNNPNEVNSWKGEIKINGVPDQYIFTEDNNKIAYITQPPPAPPAAPPAPQELIHYNINCIYCGVHLKVVPPNTVNYYYKDKNQVMPLNGQIKNKAGKSFFKFNIYPYLLISVYNNLSFNKPVHDDVRECKSFLKKSQLSSIVRHETTEHLYLILYDEDDDITTKLNDNTINIDNKISKYVFMWLSCEDADKKTDDNLKKDSFSEFINKIQKSTSKDLSKVDLEKDKIDTTNVILSQFTKEHRKQFMEEYKDLYESYIDDEIKINESQIDADKDIYSSKEPKERTEKRYYYDNPIGYKDNINNHSNKPNFINKSKIIDKPIEKKDKDRIHRIMTFNINRWCIIDDKLSNNDIYTNPSYAIDYIHKINDDSNINALCLLDYTLHNDDDQRTFLERKQRKKSRRSSSGGFFIYNNDIKQIQYGGDNDAHNLEVKNSSIQSMIANKLKLDKYILHNDNYDNKILKENIFLGKGLYYNNKIEKPDILEIKDKVNLDKLFNEKILYSEYNIDSKKIGLYFINFKSDSDKSGNVLSNHKEKIGALINKVMIHSQRNQEECVIMGNFNCSPKTHPDAFKQFETDKFKKIGKSINDSTFITGNEYDLCYVSEEFTKLYKIMNNNIIIPSGGISNHYPIYIDIIRIEDEDSIKTGSNSSSSNSSSNSSSKDLDEAEKEGTKPLLATFLKDTEGITNIEINKKNIVNSIAKMIEIIKNNLKTDKYNSISNNINGLAQSQIELKLIEKKLAPSSIKKYNKITTEYTLVNNIVESEKEKINLKDTTKELAKLLSDNPQVKGLIKTSTLSREEILDIISRLNDKTYRKNDKDETLLKKLSSNDNNVKKMIEEIGNISLETTQCIILDNLRTHSTHNLFNEAYIKLPNTSKNCFDVNKKKQDEKHQKAKQQYQSS